MVIRFDLCLWSPLMRGGHCVVCGPVSIDGDAVEGFFYCRGGQEVKFAIGYKFVP